MRDIFLTAAIVFTLTLVGVGVLTAAVVACAYPFQSYSCSQKWSDYDNEYTLFGGCRVKIDGKWVPDSRVREIDL